MMGSEKDFISKRMQSRQVMRYYNVVVVGVLQENRIVAKYYVN